MKFRWVFLVGRKGTSLPPQLNGFRFGIEVMVTVFKRYFGGQAGLLSFVSFRVVDLVSLCGSLHDASHK